MNRKRVAHPASAGIQLGLIITPMLDMSFQILAFFIMTYHPSALEAHIPGSLVPGDPAVHGPAAPDQQPLFDEKQFFEGLDDAPIVKIKVRVDDKSGAPGQIFLRIPPAVDAELLADVDVDFAVGRQRLEAHLKKLKGAHLKIAADGELRQQYVIAVYDTARKAGFDKIHFVPPPVLNSRIK